MFDKIMRLNFATLANSIIHLILGIIQEKFAMKLTYIFAYICICVCICCICVCISVQNHLHTHTHTHTHHTDTTHTIHIHAPTDCPIVYTYVRTYICMLDIIMRYAAASDIRYVRVCICTYRFIIIFIHAHVVSHRAKDRDG